MEVEGRSGVELLKVTRCPIYEVKLKMMKGQQLPSLLLRPQPLLMWLPLDYMPKCQMTRHRRVSERNRQRERQLL